jgi:hypothetical protein
MNNNVGIKSYNHVNLYSFMFLILLLPSLILTVLGKKILMALNPKTPPLLYLHTKCSG